MAHQITALYNPKNTQQTKVTFAFYVANNIIDSKVLLDFKVNTQAKLLIALVTNDIEEAILPNTDTIIYCGINAIEDVIKAFETFFKGETFIGIEPDDALVFFANQKNIHFIQASCSTTEEFIQQALATRILKMPIAKLCVLVQGEDIGFEEFNQISEAIADEITPKNMTILYALDMEGKGVNISLFAAKA